MNFKEHVDYNPKKKFQVLWKERTPNLDFVEPKVYMVIDQDVETLNIKREQEFGNIWVARTMEGKYVDRDQYRNDLFERLEIAAKKR